MKELEEYIKKHGFHFTEKLATDTVTQKWPLEAILKVTNNKMFYNVISATVGDMLYWVNNYHNLTGENKKKCVENYIQKVSNYNSDEGEFFKKYITSLNERKQSFDFSDYL